MDTTMDIRRDQWIIDHQGMCGTCHFWTKESKGHSCMCMDSPFAADWVDAEDGCNHHITKRGMLI